MAEKQSPGIAYVVSLCGIMCGLSLALMFCLGMIPGFEYVSPAVAGVLIWVVRERLGVRYGLVSYAAVGILTMLFTANYEASMMYIFLLGYYPIETVPHEAEISRAALGQQAGSVCRGGDRMLFCADKHFRNVAAS